MNVTAFLPFQCDAHPNGRKTVREGPSVECSNADDEHNTLVADMGSAHSCHGYVVGDSPQVTTLYVRAPEKLLGQTSTTDRIDTWALGVQLRSLRTAPSPWHNHGGRRTIDSVERTTTAGGRRTNDQVERTTATEVMGRRSDPECPRRNTRNRRFGYRAQVGPLPGP